MRRCIAYICLIILTVSFLWSCAHTPTKQERFFKDDKTEKRVEYLQDRLRVDSNNIEYRMELGRIFLSEGMIEDAIIELKRVLINEPERIDALLLLSLAFQKLQKPDFTKALELLTKASQVEPDNADVHLNLAQVYDKLKNKNKAIDEFKKTIELSNEPATLVSAHLGLMAIYKRQGELEKTKEEYEAAYKIYPGIEEMIKQAEISRITREPEYAGEEFRGEDGLHPSLEERIKRLREELIKMQRGEK